MEYDHDESSSLTEPLPIFDSSLHVSSALDQISFSFEGKDDNDNADNMTVVSLKSIDQLRSSGDPRSPAQMIRRLGQFNMRRDPVSHDAADAKASQTNSGSQREVSTATKKRQYRDALSSQEQARELTKRMVTAAPQQRLEEFRKKYHQLRREPKNSVTAPYDFSFRNRRDIRHYREDGFDDSLSMISYSSDTNFSAFNGSTQQNGDDNTFISHISEGSDKPESVSSFKMINHWEPPFSPVGKGKTPILPYTPSQQQSYRPSTLSQRVYDLDEILASENADAQHQGEAPMSSPAQQQQDDILSNEQHVQQDRVPTLSSHQVDDSGQSVTSAKLVNSQPNENQQQDDINMEDDDFEFDDMPGDEYGLSPPKSGSISQPISESMFAGGAEASSSKPVTQPIEDMLDDFQGGTDFNRDPDLEMKNPEKDDALFRRSVAPRSIKRVLPGSRYGLRKLHEPAETS
ncbi:hypothetical protein BX666DRAFT_851750 [Dichotomocladium elegans]|nr:hypothetical protein BX666DRAFT_851750 [Dichotomocladium elegans]